MKPQFLNCFLNYTISILSYITFVVFAVISAIVLLTIECRAVILDSIMPMNESRPRCTEVEYELFVSKQQYFVLYLMQEIFGVAIGFWSMIATVSFMIMLLKHSSAAHIIARLACVLVLLAVKYLYFFSI